MVGRLVAGEARPAPKADVAVGRTLTIEGRPWRVSGRFAAPGTLLEAEIWCPLDDLKAAMKRPNDVSVVAMRFDPRGRPRRKQMGYVDYFCRNRRPDLELMGSREAEYYATLPEALRPMRRWRGCWSGWWRWPGGCGAVNTMYAAVAGGCASSPRCRRSASRGGRSR